ncbi:unnamed protein product [Dibothriocephalus latus]|uniref:Uncharacterized protein n=1 Tax=Dibothriocephalus latus TaxID=60516 RepID=A0A3P7LRH3_DIBLA|nr:unnamed protein product [Dibothriocephalus latus]
MLIDISELIRKPSIALAIIEEVVDEVGIRNSKLPVPKWALPELCGSTKSKLPANGEITREKSKEKDNSADNLDATNSDEVRNRG